MEEDIKILEDKTNALGLFFKCRGTQKYEKALENLLTEYKNLKQIEQEHQRVNGELREKIKELEYKYERALSDLVIAENTNMMWQEHFIPKAVVENKIKELNKLIIETQKELGSASKEYTIYVYQENILQELLRLMF